MNNVYYGASRFVQISGFDVKAAQVIYSLAEKTSDVERQHLLECFTEADVSTLLTEAEDQYEDVAAYIREHLKTLN